jgi:hypothetical protein
MAALRTPRSPRRRRDPRFAVPAVLAVAGGLLGGVLPVDPAGARSVCRPPGSRASQGDSLPSGTGETSGIAFSRRHPPWGWMIRDSGHPASLYAVRFRAGGRPLVREVKVKGADNTDWEEVVYDGARGVLYIVESGQTGRDHHIYEIPEPDPARAERIRNWRRLRYAYPRGREFNTEAAFMHHGRLVLVTKTSPARVYRFDDLSRKRRNKPEYVGTLPGANRVSVTRVAPDGRTLIASNHDTLLVYRARTGSNDLRAMIGRGPTRRQRIARDDNIEAGDFSVEGRCDLVLVAESKNVYRIPSR